MALVQFGLRFRIGHHHAQLVEYFLDRSTNPTIEALQAHYPDHPRPGASVVLALDLKIRTDELYRPELENANLGLCVQNALNIKRGFWRISPNQSYSSGISPSTSTPESAAYASSAAGHGQMSSASGSNKSGSLRRIDSDSPRGALYVSEDRIQTLGDMTFGKSDGGVAEAPLDISADQLMEERSMVDANHRGASKMNFLRNSSGI